MAINSPTAPATAAPATRGPLLRSHAHPGLVLTLILTRHRDFAGQCLPLSTTGAAPALTHRRRVGGRALTEAGIRERAETTADVIVGGLTGHTAPAQIPSIASTERSL
jgi:hypothetical protein